MMINSYVLMERRVICGVGVLKEAVFVSSVLVVLTLATVSGLLPTTRSSNVSPTVKTMGDTGTVQEVCHQIISFCHLSLAPA